MLSTIRLLGRHVVPAACAALAAWALPAVAAQDTASNDQLNLAVVAAPSTSFVSGHETLEAINDGFDPRRSNDTRHGQYGNWPSQGTQWVQLEWSQPISSRTVDVYWWNDQRGVRLPQACRLSYWDGTAFVPVGIRRGWAWKRTDTTRRRLTRSPPRSCVWNSTLTGQYSTGIIEWKVYDSGKSPAFPPTVKAGTDRLVMVGGKTWLRGHIQTLSGRNDTVVASWTQADGPGNRHICRPACGADDSNVLRARRVHAEIDRPSATRWPPPRPCPSKLPPARRNSICGRSTRGNTPFTARSGTSVPKALIVNWIPHCIRKISDPQSARGGHQQLHRRRPRAGRRTPRGSSRIRLLERLGVQHDRVDLRRPNGRSAGRRRDHTGPGGHEGHAGRLDSQDPCCAGARRIPADGLHAERSRALVAPTPRRSRGVRGGLFSGSRHRAST